MKWKREYGIWAILSPFQNGKPDNWRVYCSLNFKVAASCVTLEGAEAAIRLLRMRIII